ncbi:MAG: YdbL family protein [Alphaproteobacteria bacterium]|jgi:uncharacterized protein YdbL (DUF1318 family)|nr:YdbL family protein [Alphaproteobacteria bacterium]
MMKKVSLILGLGLVSIFPTDAALDLGSALSSKKVCEKADGFIQATAGNEGEVSELVNQVNAKRANVYSNIAQKDGLDPAVVAAESAADEKAAHPGKFCS